VYQAFDSLEDFETAIALLRHESVDEPAGPPAKTVKNSEKSPL
jgi:transcriptional repressor NrdR